MTSLGGLKLADGDELGVAGTSPLGGEAGSGVDAATWELRSSKAARLMARSSERSYSWNSGWISWIQGKIHGEVVYRQEPSLGGQFGNNW